MTSVNLTRPQFKFLKLKQKFRGYVGGFGSGKTYVGCCSLIEHHNNHQNVPSGYFGPTYRSISDVFYPTVDEVAYAHGWKTTTHTTNKEINYFLGKRYKGTTVCRSMDNPQSIIGFKIGKALVDELDTLAADKAKLAWVKIIARMRYKIAGLRNSIDVTTTPEGFKFTHDRFVKNTTPLYGLVQASTYENAINLNDDYIPSLLDSYSPELVNAYLEGMFVNLTSGSVYSSFDRSLNNASGVIPKQNEPLHIGMDFNVGNMSAVIHVVRQGRPCAVGELVEVLDTPAMINAIQQAYPGHFITIYPDASGAARKTVNASTSDLKLLSDAGFQVRVNYSNPAVKDRVNSMNAMFLNMSGERRYFINVANCPNYVDSLEQQAYDKNGQPDKQSGFDHLPDGAGYYIERDFGISKPSAQTGRVII